MNMGIPRIRSMERYLDCCRNLEPTIDAGGSKRSWLILERIPTLDVALAGSPKTLSSPVGVKTPLNTLFDYF